MHVQYRVRRTEQGLVTLEANTSADAGREAWWDVWTGRSPAEANRRLHEVADRNHLTVFHRDVFSAVQEDGSHEVLGIAASMSAPA